MISFFKVKLTDKQMSDVMYAILLTKAKLLNSYGVSIYKFNRKQNRGCSIDVVVEVENVALFEELSGVKLQTSDEFQGELRLSGENGNRV